MSNAHITHIEDLLFEEGTLGTWKCLRILKEIAKGSKPVTVKMDGSPAIIIGKDPLTWRFFVSTKSALNKVPIVCWSHSDIKEKFGHIPEVSHALAAAFDAYSKHIFKGMFMADVMFIPPSIQKEENGISFRMNTIRYHIEDPNLVSKVKASTIGLAFHTAFVINDKSEIVPAPYKGELETPSNVFDFDIEVNHLWRNKHFDFLYDFDKLYSLHNLELPSCLMQHTKYLKQYSNWCIRNNTVANIVGYLEFILSNIKTKHRDELYTKAADQNILFDNLFNVYKEIQQVKEKLINSLNQQKTIFTKYTIDINNMSIATDSEGYVYRGDDIILKLVNRKEFSRYNFQRERS